MALPAHLSGLQEGSEGTDTYTHMHLCRVQEGPALCHKAWPCQPCDKVAISAAWLCQPPCVFL